MTRVNSHFFKIFLTALSGIFLLVLSGQSLGQVDDESGSQGSAGSESSAAGKPKSAKDEDDENVIKAPPPVPAKKRTFTPSEIRQQCAKYEGKYIAYYTDVYKVEKCQRRQVIANESVFKLMQAGAQISEVPAIAIAAIPEGASLDMGNSESKSRPCSTFNGKYITYSHSDVHFVERCTRYLIPDYETFVSHRKQKGISPNLEILALNWNEYSGLKVGAELESILVKEYAKLLDMAPAVDVIPIDEACKGLNGKTVSFYSRIYRVEKCRKREYDPELLLRKSPNIAIVELKPEQWISIPDGAPMDAPPVQGKVEQFDPGAPK